MLFATNYVPDAAFLLSLVGSLGFLAWTWNQLKQGFGRSAEKREVSFTTEHASKSELRRVESTVEKLEEKLETAVADLRTEMKEDRETLLVAGETRAGKLHQRIDLILAAVSKLQGWTERDAARMELQGSRKEGI